MPLQKIGLNISQLNNVTAPDFNISSGVTNFVNDIPVKANKYTAGHLGAVILAFVFTYLYWKLADVSVEASFRYSKLRSIAISSGIAGVVGMFMINVGYFTKLYPVVFCIVIFMITFILVIREER